MEKTKKYEAGAELESIVMTPEALLEHWQGHRRLTRKVIEAFPEDKLFSYSVGGMRPFAHLAMEMIDMAVPGLKGIVTRTWGVAPSGSSKMPSSRKELLQLWDDATAEIDLLWPQIPANRFQEVDRAFGQWEGTIHWIMFYFIDNEIHHRAQGYVYLRSLGVQPPPFWER